MDGARETRDETVGRRARFRAAGLGALACAAALLASLPAARAHPHVWIDNSVVVRFEHAKIAALDVSWVFDEFYSADTIQDFDEGHKGTLDQAELGKLAATGVKSLKGYNYFSYLYLDGKKTPVASVTHFAVGLEKNILVYRFTIPVSPPIDPKARKFAFAIYDDSYFVDIEPAKTNPVTFAGDVPKGCAARAAEDKNDPYYFGQVYPLVVSVTCP
ncbi:MAG TPA: DUF1007 family protein [Alphaproteobacteria bacterium]|nr:DUF1007 family protein [Alphaproteobacteria bacterium]